MLLILIQHGIRLLAVDEFALAEPVTTTLNYDLR
jgi:hypothetical protein